MAGNTNPHDLEQTGPGWPPTTRPVVYATHGVISSGHYLTSMAGMRMLLSGGNAFDAVVAASFAAAVVEPIASYSLGAEGVFMLYDAKSQDLLALSGQGVAPGGATIDFYRSQGLDAIPTGPDRRRICPSRCPASSTPWPPCWSGTGPRVSGRRWRRPSNTPGRESPTTSTCWSV